MPLKNLNVEPYFDDLDEDKKFIKILFRPQFAVQTRELNQLQSLLQLQISRFGDHVFQHGAMVLPGQIGFDKFAEFVKVSVDPTNLGSLTEEEYLNTYFLNQTITGQTSGVTGYVFHIESKNTQNNDSATLYIRYTGAGTDSSVKKFSNSEILKSSLSTNIVQYVANTTSTESTGIGSLASIQRGVYYIYGYFVVVEPQTITLDKYSNEPSYLIGLQIVDKIVTPEEDVSLFDNANGFPNASAPGAHRYVIDLVLTKFSLNSTPTNDFIELLRVKDGNVQQKVVSTQYSEIEKTLARRTEDQSGDFVINGLSSSIKEHRNNDRGLWAANTRYVKKDIVLNGENYYECTTEGNSGNAPPVHTYGIVSDGGVSWEYVKLPIYSNGVYKASVIGEFKNDWKFGIQYLQNDIVFSNGNYYVALTSGKSGNIQPIHTSGNASDGGVTWQFYTGDVSNISGGDETKIALVLDSGKLYVDGYEINKQVTEYVALDKARDFEFVSSNTMSLELGSYVLVNNIYGMPRANLNETVDLRNAVTATPGTAAGSSVGSAKIRAIYPDGSNYRIYLFDIQMSGGNKFDRNVRQLAITQESSRKFTADVIVIATKQPGLISTTSSSTTINGNSTTNVVDFSKLQVNDYIRIEGIASGSAEYKIATINTSNNTLTTTSAVSATLIDTAFYLITSPIYNVNKESSIFALPQKYIKTLRANDGVSVSMSLYLSYYDTVTSNGSGTITILKPGSNTSFAPISTSSYMLVNASSGAVITLTPGSNITINGSGSLVITGLSNSTAYRILYTVIKVSSDAKEKTKTITKGELVVTNAPDLANRTFSLKPDVYKLLKVEYFSDKNAGDVINSSDIGTDVTDRFLLDGGQRPTFYGLGVASIKPEYSLFAKPIRITYEYFSHGAGDYFSVDSYPINYEEIDPILRDSLDFRPSVSNSGDFGSGSDITLLPAHGYNVQFDFSYYLYRKDSVLMDNKGNYVVIKGTPSLNPNLPSIPNSGIHLFDISYDPYTILATKDYVKITSINNRRYTMRDIGMLEQRIQNLEYYTTLTLLEKETESLSIKDEFGLDRFKCGFVVDSFKDVGVALDEAKKRNTFSIDVFNKQLRPAYNVEHLNIDEEDAGNRIKNHYVVSQGTNRQEQIFTLPYQNELIISQKVASKTENVNPFAVFKFIGELYINPSVDDWIDINRLPNVELLNNSSSVPPGIYDGEVIYGAWEWGPTQTQYNILTTVADRSSFVNPTPNNELNGYSGGTFKHVDQDVLQQVVVSQVGQRKVITNSVQTTVNRTLVNDVVLNVQLEHYIRPRNILFKATGLKSNAKLYAFFDNISVDSYIVPSTILNVSGRTGSFYTDQIAVGDSANNVARQDEFGTDISLNTGDIIYGNTSGATGILVLTETTSTSDKLYLVNIKGQFKAGETVRVKYSLRSDEGTATLVSVESPTTLKTNSAGQVAGIFKLPSNNKLTFTIGEREFKLTDSQNNSEGTSTTSASTKYKAKGTLETKQATYLTTRNSTVTQSVSTQTTTNVISADTSVQNIQRFEAWYDPLAQSFLINEVDKLTNKEPSGVFITKVTVYFATKDPVVPIRCEIREMVNGYPTNNVIPGSVVYKFPSTINVSTNSSIGTDFIFDNPLYLQNKKEFALVLISDSNQYNVYISQMGENDLLTANSITEQPYLGVLFKSQNSSTWTTSDLQDLKFDLYRAKFDNSIPGTVKLVNQPIPKVKLINDPFEVNTTTATVIVHQANHGLFTNSKVNISNVKSGELVVGSVTVSGYNISDILKLNNNYRAVGLTSAAQGIILNVEFNDPNYNIDIAQSKNSYYGSNNTNFTNSEIIKIEYQDPSGSWIDTTFRATVSSFTSVTYEGISGKDFNNQFTISSGNILDYDRFKIPVSNVATVDGMLVGGNNVYSERNISFDVLRPNIRAFVEPNTRLETFIDTLTGQTLGGNQTPGTNLINLDIVYNKDNLMPTPCSVFSNTNNNNKPSLSVYCKMLSETDYLSPVIDNVGSSVILIQNKIDDLTGSNEATQTFGDNSSKYITKTFVLENPATSIKILFSANLATENDIFLYYRTLNVGNSTNIDSISWNLLSPETTISKVQDNSFVDVSYIANNIESFNQFQIKIVMKSVDSTIVPKIKDFRVIALA